MWKRAFQILSLVVTVLYLVYLVLSYYGVLRTWGFRYRDLNSYIQAYPNLPKADKNKVMICFTCNERDFDHLENFLKSILDQSVRVDTILLVIPYKAIGKVPEDVKKVVTIQGYSKDYDPDVACSICSVLREPEAQTKIILVEPAVYGFDFVQSMVEASNENPNKIIYGCKSGDLKHGILIKPSFFSESITEMKKGTSCCNWIKSHTQVSDKVVDYMDVK